MDNVSNGSSDEEDISKSGHIDVAAAHDYFEIEGVSQEELRYWSQLAPQDQKLDAVDEMLAEGTSISGKRSKDAAI